MDNRAKECPLCDLMCIAAKVPLPDNIPGDIWSYTYMYYCTNCDIEFDTNTVIVEAVA